MLTDSAVLEERGFYHMTPLIFSTFESKPAIALWLIEHRGQDDVDTQSDIRWTAMHWACTYGLLSVVQALVAAGANASIVDSHGWTALIHSSIHCYADIVTFLLQQPATKATIDASNSDRHDKVHIRPGSCVLGREVERIMDDLPALHGGGHGGLALDGDGLRAGALFG